MLGLVGTMGYRARQDAVTDQPANPVEQPGVAVVEGPAAGSVVAEGGDTTAPPATSTPDARPQVRPAPPQTQAPAASTHGSH
jgi:hypothetical protein